MDPRAALVAAKMTGRLEVLVAIGRLDYIDRFQPFGTKEATAEVRQGENGLWIARVENVHITYSHDSPRIITHVGMLLYSGWSYDEIPIVAGQSYAMQAGNTAAFTIEHPLPETLQWDASQAPKFS